MFWIGFIAGFVAGMLALVGWCALWMTEKPPKTKECPYVTGANINCLTQDSCEGCLHTSKEYGVSCN